MSLLTGQTLAYLGDAVYELELRSQCIQTGIHRPDALHQMVSELTSGKAQAWAFSILDPLLTESEKAWFKRGRNAPLSKKSRKGSNEEAHTSSGFEAIFGGLFNAQENARITWLCHYILATKNPSIFSKPAPEMSAIMKSRGAV